MRPSPRLVRAVTAEREELARHRARLTQEADELREALARIERGLDEIDERCELLDRIAPAPAQAPAPHETPPSRAGLLRGPKIREAAVAALLESGSDALHYRDWYELLTRDGREIAGKDPLAVFLTQISRSPLLRKGARPGVYELDRDAPQRLRRTLDDLHKELRELTASGDLTKIRARRAQLTAEIGRTERALEEVTRVAA